MVHCATGLLGCAQLSFGYRTATVCDAAGRSIAQINPLGQRVTSVYDAAGRRTRVVDANAHLVTFLFDLSGHDLGSIDPLGRRVTMTYDAAGNLSRKLTCRNALITMSYDANKRLTGRNFSGGRHTFVYDGAGQRTVMSDSTGRTTSTYSKRGEVLTATNPDSKRVTYVYTKVANRRQSLSDPDNGRFTYSFDAAGRLNVLRNPQNKRTSFSYSVIGQQTRQVHGNGSVTTQLYNADSRLTGVSNSGAAGVIVNRFTYTYDGAGKRTIANELGGVRTSWTYDNAGQLLRELRNGTNNLAVTYSYDPTGNRLRQIDSGVITTYTHDIANQLSRENAAGTLTTYTYDTCGNRTQKTAATTTYYQWDVLNRMTANEPVAGPVTFTYNADNKRVEKQTGSAQTSFLYDFESVLREYDSNSGALKTEFTTTATGYGDLVSQYDGANTLYHEYDVLGSTDALINDAQTATDRYVYRAYGLATHKQGTTSSTKTFVGKQGYYQDLETDLYLLGSRYYDPEQGRFVSEDPIGYRDDINLYRYVRNNPVNGIDPSGNALFVPRNTRITRTSCGIQTFSSSLLPRLESMFQRDFQQAGVSGGPIILTTVGSANSMFDKVSLFWEPAFGSGVPYSYWEYAREYGQTGSLTFSAPNLLQFLSISTNDYVLRPRRWYTSLGTNDRWLSDDSLYIQEATASASTSTLSSVISHIGSLLSSAASGALQAVGNTGRVALAALLRGAGIDGNAINSFFDAWTSFGSTATQITTGILTNPGRFAQSLLAGAAEGFWGFLTVPRLLDVFFKWIFGPQAPSASLLSPYTQTSVARYFLSLLGVDSVLNTIQDKADQLTNLQMAFSDLAQGNLPSGLVGESLQEAELTPTSIFNQAWQLVVSGFAQAVTNFVFGALPRFLGSGVTAIVNFLSWLVENANVLAQLAQSFTAALVAATSGTVEVVKNAVIGGLVQLGQVFLRLLARLTGLDSIIQYIRCTVMKLKDWVACKVQRLLSVLRRKSAGMVTVGTGNMAVSVRYVPSAQAGGTGTLEVRIGQGQWRAVSPWITSQLGLCPANMQAMSKAQMAQMTAMLILHPPMMASQTNPTPSPTPMLTDRPRSAGPVMQPMMPTGAVMGCVPYVCNVGGSSNQLPVLAQQLYDLWMMCRPGCAGSCVRLGTEILFGDGNSRAKIEQKQKEENSGANDISKYLSRNTSITS